MRETFTIYNEDEEEEFNMDNHLDNLQNMFRRQSDVSTQSTEKPKKKKKIPTKFTKSLPFNH